MWAYHFWVEFEEETFLANDNAVVMGKLMETKEYLQASGQSCPWKYQSIHASLRFDW